MFFSFLEDFPVGMQRTVMCETPTGNRWLRNVIEYTRCDRCISVKCELQRDLPVESIRKREGDSA